jgi:hypothetical protein
LNGPCRFFAWGEAIGFADTLGQDNGACVNGSGVHPRAAGSHQNKGYQGEPVVILAQMSGNSRPGPRYISHQRFFGLPNQ